MIRYDDALARILENVHALQAVEAAPLRLLGLHLAEPLVAPIALPPFDDAAMDGWAIRALAGPAELREGIDAAPVATGDPVPAWAEAVVQLELCSRDGELVQVRKAVPAGANIRRRGEDVRAGEVVAPAGARVDAAIALAAAALGVERLRAVRRVRGAVLPVGHHLASGRPDATGPGVAATLRSWGAGARLLEPATGDVEAVAARIGAASARADLLVTCGAASVGENDVVPAALERLGARVIFHGVSIKPGKPIGVALLEGRVVLMLPGSPAAALAGLEGIGRVVHGRLAGDPLAGGALLQAVAGREITRRKGKTGLLRGRLVASAGGLVFLPQEKQGPAQISAVVGTNALCVLGPDVERVERGAPVAVRSIGQISAAAPPRVICVCGWSGAGKTWVVERLVERLSARGLRVATVKHDGHGFEPSGKDTERHRRAGAIATALVDDERVQLVREGAASLESLAAELRADLVIAEGFKGDGRWPKIEVIARGREPVGASPLLAIVSDREVEGRATVVAPDEAGMDRLAELVAMSLR